MSFEVLIKQVQAIASVTGQMSGHVSSAYAKASGGALTSSVLGAQLMMGDALRLLAILREIPSFNSSDFDLGLGEVIFSNALSWAAVMQAREQTQAEVDQVKEVTNGLQKGLDLVLSQIGQIIMIREQLASLQSIVGADAAALSGARALLDEQVMPALYQFRSLMEELLWTYERELQLRELSLWRMDTVFKYIAPARRLRDDNWRRRKSKRRKKRLKKEKKKLAKKLAKKLREDQGTEAPGGASVPGSASAPGSAVSDAKANAPPKVEGARTEDAAPAVPDEGVDGR